MEKRWWERFWKYKVKDNNQHDWFMVWADLKLLEGQNKAQVLIRMAATH